MRIIGLDIHRVAHSASRPHHSSLCWSPSIGPVYLVSVPRKLELRALMISRRTEIKNIHHKCPSDAAWSRAHGARGDLLRAGRRRRLPHEPQASAGDRRKWVDRFKTETQDRIGCTSRQPKPLGAEVPSFVFRPTWAGISFVRRQDA